MSPWSTCGTTASRNNHWARPRRRKGARGLGLDYLHYGVGAAPLTEPGVTAVCDFIDRHAQGSDRVLVHCRKGGRAIAILLLQQARARPVECRRAVCEGKGDGSRGRRWPEGARGELHQGARQGMNAGVRTEVTRALVSCSCRSSADPRIERPLRPATSIDFLRGEVLSEHLDRLVLPVERGGEISDLRAGGGECVQAIGILPPRELAGSVCLI